ncbi:MAG: hypothetical protein PF568_06605, partial [Deltaproteobacteria bacterium]|nr:hypothetical protein [Deltaproteobacteria bacterium]
MYLSHYLKIYRRSPDFDFNILFSTKSGAVVAVDDDDLAALQRGDFSEDMVLVLQGLVMVVEDLEV